MSCRVVKILHLEQNPGPSAAPNSFWGERTVCFLCFLFLFPTLRCMAPREGVKDSQSTLCCVASHAVLVPTVLWDTLCPTTYGGKTFP